MGVGRSDILINAKSAIQLAKLTLLSSDEYHYVDGPIDYSLDFCLGWKYQGHFQGITCQHSEHETSRLC